MREKNEDDGEWIQDMGNAGKEGFSRLLTEKVKELGADGAGIVNVRDLRSSPSEQLFPKMKDHARDHFVDIITTGLPHGKVYWEEDAKSVLVFYVRHPEDKPELDWWKGEINPPGNKLLMKIARQFREYIETEFPDIHVYPKPYHVERGGVYLKDAAVLAGLGCIGRNNLLVTPEFGPQVRLRAIALSVDLPSDGPACFDPCRDCPAPCIRSCPRGAFDDVIYTPEETGILHLPARGGNYYRLKCSYEMKENEDEAEKAAKKTGNPEEAPMIKYCRECEFSCIAAWKGTRLHN